MRERERERERETWFNILLDDCGSHDWQLSATRKFKNSESPWISRNFSQLIIESSFKLVNLLKLSGMVVLVFSRTIQINTRKYSDSIKSNSITFSPQRLSYFNLTNPYSKDLSKELRIGLCTIVQRLNLSSCCNL